MSKIHFGKQPGPRRVVIYGGPGVGKSTWASTAPKPIFVPTEDGLRDIDCASYPVAKSYAEWQDNLKDLVNHVDQFQTVVIDSLDWLESLVWKSLCEEDGVETIEQFGKGYGKGYTAAAARFDTVLRGLNWFTSKGLHVVCICHDIMTKVEDSENPPYDRVGLRLHKASAGKVVEWADEILYFRSKIVVEEGERSNKARGGKVREIICNNRPAILAKNRLRMPDTIPQVDPATGNPWAEYAKYMKQEAQNG